jgi:UDP-N-acetylmuramoyl-tripeptide--D-alanyl-D-alanine ligase
VAGRLQPLQGQNGATLYDDSYNANPLSVTAAAEFLAALPGQSWFVLGDMFELGESATEMHRDVGASIQSAGVNRLLTLGELSQAAADGFGEGATSFDSIEDLIAELSAGLVIDVNLLVKGSRGMRMERVVNALCAPEALRKGA